MQVRVVILVIVLFISRLAVAQKNADVIQYIDTYKNLAIEEELRTGVPASIKLAQGIHETQAGKSNLVLKSNNHFGIKCKVEWNGDRVYHDDDRRNECFRSYASPADSYLDHSEFLRGSQRYAFLFELDPTDYKAWAYGLKKAGYATNVKYSQILIKLIEDYDLQQYTLIALGKLPGREQLAKGNATNAEADSKMLELPGTQNNSPTVQNAKVSYPAGEFTINRTRVIYAVAGTSLIWLARQNDIALSRLLEFNELQTEDVLIEDQLLYLQRKRKMGATEFHIVQAGENVYSICQAEGIRLESLLQFNQLQSGMQPATGQKLYLQSRAGVRPLLAQELSMGQQTTAFPGNDTADSQSYTTHVVNNQETLYTISKKYGVQIKKIKEWNKLSDNRVTAGQELIIYKN